MIGVSCTIPITVTGSLYNQQEYIRPWNFINQNCVVMQIIDIITLWCILQLQCCILILDTDYKISPRNFEQFVSIIHVHVLNWNIGPFKNRGERDNYDNKKDYDGKAHMLPCVPLYLLGYFQSLSCLLDMINWIGDLKTSQTKCQSRT